MKLIFYIIFAFLYIPCCIADNGIYFSPSKNCENNIVKFMDKSTEQIDAAIYAINNTRIIKALKRAHDRGVKIRILTDRLQAAQKSSKVLDLKKYGINIRVHSKYKIEHNKFATFDKKIAVSGSYNWTTPASDKNSENCAFFIRNKTVVKEYQDRFEYLWRINTKKKSDEWFEREKL